MGATDLSVLPQRSVVFPETVFRGLAPADVPLRVEGVVSQTGNLFESRDSNGVVLSSISSTGRFVAPNGVTATGNFGKNFAIEAVAGDASVQPLVVKGFSGQTGNLTEWRDSAGAVLSRIRSDGIYVGNGLYSAIEPVSGVHMVAGSTFHGNIPFAVRGAASQSANLTEWQNSAGAKLATINNGGAFTSFSGAPLVLNGGGSGTFTQTVIYSDVNNSFFIDLGRVTDSSTATPRNFVIQARGGGHPNAITVEPERTVMNGSLVVIANTSFQGQNTRGLMVGNDLWIYDVNIGNAIGFSGVGNPEAASLLLGRSSNNAPRVSGNDVNKTISLNCMGGDVTVTGGQFYVNEVNFSVNTNGRTRIGTTDTQYAIGVNTTAGGSSPGFMRFNTNDGPERAYLRWDGHWFAAGYNGISAEATKDDIRTLEVSQPVTSGKRSAVKGGLVERFRAVRPVDFAPKAGMQGDRRMLSFVAEELSEVLPEATAYDADGNPAGVNLNAMITILTAMVQDQQKKIEALEARVA